MCVKDVILVLLRILDPYASVLHVQDARFALLHVRTGLLVEDLAMLVIDLGIVRGLLVLWFLHVCADLGLLVLVMRDVHMLVMKKCRRGNGSKHRTTRCRGLGRSWKA